MTVEENLAMGADLFNDDEEQQKNLTFVFELFPWLKERKNQLAGTMNVGKRKMLAIARGMMSSPDLLLVDEPSLGLASQLIKDVFKALDVLNERGMTLLLVELNVTKTL